MLHVGEQEGVGGAGVMRIMDDQVGFGDAVAKLHDFDVAIGLAANALVSFLPKTRGLPCSSWITCSLRASFSVIVSQAPSLKILQFCRISTKADPL